MPWLLALVRIFWNRSGSPVVTKPVVTSRTVFRPGSVPSWLMRVTIHGAVFEIKKEIPTNDRNLQRCFHTADNTMTKSDYSVLVAQQREFFLSGATRPDSWRKAQLEAVKALFTENHDELCDALWKDLQIGRAHV